MGNSKDTTRPRKKNQPEQLLSTGEKDRVQGGGNVDSLIIKLVKLSMEVLTLVKNGDKVIVLLNDDTYTCLYNNQRLGDVPRYYNNKLLPATTFNATIQDIQQSPVSVIIKLH